MLCLLHSFSCCLLVFISVDEMDVTEQAVVGLASKYHLSGSAVSDLLQIIKDRDRVIEGALKKIAEQPLPVSALSSAYSMPKLDAKAQSAFDALVWLRLSHLTLALTCIEFPLQASTLFECLSCAISTSNLPFSPSRTEILPFLYRDPIAALIAIYHNDRLTGKTEFLA